jgi:hypothetical protein
MQNLKVINQLDDQAQTGQNGSYWLRTGTGTRFLSVITLGLVGNSVTNYAEISFIRRTTFYRGGCFISYMCLDLLWCAFIF